ncbi:glycoside hydrolase family 5 protein [Penicillium atrosanguineum]|uniref:glycoside hydrolase family 5 protein n=1 Tax=Penicillium atrosanguineum TaxID=1132637 RepID=UPI00239CE860|nr:glycoside hydrolase family 5 protein [Penicillium atrosanguineum]KAJ5147288.1 hypothetical protein N7526_000640 [Penicillium atrosanguineum]KAJ5314232.1 glycoside hydrolase family 5 protein [Penicillium atrosanguineum]
MSRPQMIRADTLDLQDHDAPSAQDHSKQPQHPDPLGGGRPAPHQSSSIRHAEEDLKSEITNGPGTDSASVYDDDDIEADVAGNADYDHDDSDLADGESDDLMDDDLMDKISSSPSIDDEDIDFEFVYALHNFVATVDGQANAAKGDTMVLLDDSNSYWWLVRVVKDGSIGYLPAEHIETPTERLARLNKHRNVDLSATMLGDNSEKSKNPLKKAMRRRNAKTVNFAPPTYIEASDVEYSTDEDDEHGDFFNDDETVESEDEGQEQNEDIVVEPLRPKGQREKSSEKTEGAEAEDRAEPEQSISDPRRSSEEFFDPEVEPAVSRSRNGTVRNTDSFFKDDTAEPKKISLTPNLLRDESNSNNNSNNSLLNEWKDGRGSFESIEKASSSQEKLSKDDKKRKDKKPGMLSGLFKRGKKNKSTDEDMDEPLSPADSSFRTSPKTSMESTMSQESRTRPTRQASNKLQKQPPAAMSPTSPTSPADQTQDIESALASQAAPSIRQVTTTQEVESFEEEDRKAVASPAGQSSPSKDSFATPMESRDPFASPEDRSSSEAHWREPYSSDRTATIQHSVVSPPQRFVPTMGTSYHSSGSESPVNIFPAEGHIPISAPGLTPDTTQRGYSVSPPSPPSSPEADSHDLKGTDATQGSLDTLSVDTPTWSDASLRSYMDEENDIRDLFIIVHDKSNIPPAGPEHPVTGRLFKEESKRLKEMNNQLDDMLVKWMAQRARRNSLRSVQSPTS